MGATMVQAGKDVGGQRREAAKARGDNGDRRQGCEMGWVRRGQDEIHLS